MDRSRFIYTIVILMLGLALAPTALARENLVINGSFENFNSNTMRPSDWRLSTYDRSDVEYAVDSKVFRSGSHSMRVKGNPKPSVRRGARGSVGQFIDIEPGETYKLSAWYRTEKDSKPEPAVIRLIFRDSSNEAVVLREDFSFEVFYPTALHHRYEGQGLVYFHPVSEQRGDWTLIETAFKAPDEAIRVHLELFLWHADTVIWWDDVELRRAD